MLDGLQDRAHQGTVKGAETLLVCPWKVQVTVCVPVPGVVFETVRYDQLTAPSPPAVSVGVRPSAVLVRPEGSTAVAVHCAPGAVLALSSP